MHYIESFWATGSDPAGGGGGYSALPSFPAGIGQGYGEPPPEEVPVYAPEVYWNMFLSTLIPNVLVT